jgi:hypothetical protein
MWLKVKLVRPSNQWYAYFFKCNVYISVYLHICSRQFLCNNKTHTHIYNLHIHIHYTFTLYIYIIHIHYTYTFYIYIIHIHYTSYIIHYTYTYTYTCWRIWMIAYKYTVYSFNLYIHAKLQNHIYIYTWYYIYMVIPWTYGRTSQHHWFSSFSQLGCWTETLWVSGFYCSGGLWQKQIYPQQITCESRKVNDIGTMCPPPVLNNYTNYSNYSRLSHILHKPNRWTACQFDSVWVPHLASVELSSMI